MTLLPIVTVLFIAVLLFFFILKDLDAMSKKQKIIGFLVILAIGIGIGIYSFQKSQDDKKIFLLRMEFLRGKPLMCQNLSVDAKNFNLVDGTLSLIGKDHTPYKNMSIQLSDCIANPIDNDAIQEQLEKD